MRQAGPMETKNACACIGLCPVSAGEPLKAAHLENDMHWRRENLRSGRQMRGHVQSTGET